MAKETTLILNLATVGENVALFVGEETIVYVQAEMASGSVGTSVQKVERSLDQTGSWFSVATVGTPPTLQGPYDVAGVTWIRVSVTTADAAAGRMKITIRAEGLEAGVRTIS